MATVGTSSATSQKEHRPSPSPGKASSEICIKMLEPLGFTDDEKEQLVTDILALKKRQIQEFLVQLELPKSGTKAELRSRIEESLLDGTISPEQIVRYLDEVVPWGKQHVYLYGGPKTSMADWKDVGWFEAHLKQHRLGKYLNAVLPLMLPEQMKISSILHNGRRIRVIAIKKREWDERDPEYDESKQTEAGEAVKLRAFVHRVMRGLVAFEWDLISNTAFLQISQLPRGVKYEEVAEEFFDLTAGWLDISRFPILELRKPIQKLHKLEEDKAGETRSHGINYRTMEGRRLEGKSASPSDPLLGDPVIDTAFATMRDSGVAHLGNFYWLPNGAANPGVNPLESEVHVLVVGQHNRISFPTPNKERAVRYVLSRIRSHC